MTPDTLDFNTWFVTSYVPIAGGESPPAAPPADPAAPPSGEPAGEGGAPEGEPGGEGEGAPEGGDLDAIQGRMEQVLSGFEQRVDQRIGGLEERLPEPEPEPEQTLPNREQDPEAYAEAMLQRAADAAAERALQPHLERQETERREREAVELVREYPELDDQQTAETLMGEARRWAAGFGNEQLAAEPGFLELVHLAGKAASAAESETPAGGDGGGVQLEGGGGNPGAPPTNYGQERADEIANAEKRHPFWQ